MPEMTDAMEVLISNGCSNSAIPILRSSFEALLALDYILEDDRDYSTRSLCWLAAYYMKRITLYKSFLPTTAEGKTLGAAIRKDRNIHRFPTLPAPQVQNSINNLEKLLRKKQFKQISPEFRRPGSKKTWYSLFGGPRDLQQLANYVGRHAQYEFLYRSWSRVAHAQDFSSFLDPISKSEAGVRRLRDSEQIRQVSIFAATFAIDATRKMLLKFRSEEQFAEYYTSEIRDLFSSLCRPSDQTTSR